MTATWARIRHLGKVGAESPLWTTVRDQVRGGSLSEMRRAARRTRGLPDDIASLIARHRGVITLEDGQHAGVLPRRIAYWRSQGRLTRVGHGVYASTAELDSADSWRQLSLRGQGLALSLAPAAFLAGEAAASLLGLRTVGRAPTSPEVVAPPYTRAVGRASPYGRVRRARLPARHMRTVRGRIQVMSRAWIAVDLARKLPIAHALAMIDGVTRDHLIESSQPEPSEVRRIGTDLTHAAASFTRWPGHARAMKLVALADPYAERAIETAGRIAFLAAGLPVPVSNAWVRLRDGRWRRVDHLWPWHGVVGEADGALKYDDVANPSVVIADEKEREWELRELDLIVGRYTWELSRRPDTLGGRFRYLLDANPPRPQPIRYWLGLSVDTLVEATPEDWPSPDPVPSPLPAGRLW